MMTRILALAALASALLLSGCAGDLRIGGEKHGFGAGAGIGTHPPVYYPAP